jgi:prepilin-type N-terminal cleavage/methylation domain-containing protein/prepilin-type processing-associated H-X9-DG protein
MNGNNQRRAVNALCPREKGFTLIELLVVFAIVGLLASLLLTGLANAKSQAQSASCLNNLRQLGVALTIYASDANAFPLATSNGITGAWQPALQTVSAGLMFSCPAQVTPSANFTHIFRWSGALISPYYGYNAFGANLEGAPPYNPGLGGDVNLFTASRTPTPANRVVSPSQMITIGDSPTFIDVIFGTQPQTNIPNQIYIAFPYVFSSFNCPGVGNWHGSNANFLFDDGHVQMAPQSFWVAATDQSRRLWNSDNQPHEDWW